MKILFSLIILSSCTLLLAGCKGGLSPELSGLSNRKADAKNMVAVTNNQNWRMISDDLYRAFYLDHPSRLSSYPVNYTSGSPR